MELGELLLGHMSINMKLVDKVRTLISRNNTIKKNVKVILSPFLRILEARSIKDYSDWLTKHSPTETEFDLQRASSKTLRFRPLISIVVPVYSPPKKFFIEMIESVINQTYDNWQLILVDDASPVDWVKKEIEIFAKKDSRIQYLFLTENLHIAGATNKGIEKSTGQYVALLDNDDILSPDAMFEVVNALNHNSELKFIYSDEDKIEGETGRHISPYFKPSWNPDFLYSVNYITHLSVIKKDFLNEIGGLNGRFNGAQDWELFLRIGRSIDPAYIHHIPKILYSWRVHELSTASGIEVKPYVVEAQRKAIEADLHARGYKQYTLTQDSSYPAQWHVKFSLLKKQTVHIYVEDNKQLLILKKLIEQGHATAYYSVSLRRNGLDTEAANTTSAEYLLYIPKASNVRNLNFVDQLIEDAQRPDIAFVMPCHDTPEKIMENIKAMINHDALGYVNKTSARDVTKHFYLTTRYNVPLVIKDQAYCIQTSKLQQVLEGLDVVLLSDAAAVVEKYNYRNLYNPYISLL